MPCSEPRPKLTQVRRRQHHLATAVIGRQLAIEKASVQSYAYTEIGREEIGSRASRAIGVFTLGPDPRQNREERRTEVAEQPRPLFDKPFVLHLPGL